MQLNDKTNSPKINDKIKFNWSSLVLEGIVISVYSNGDFAVQLTNPVYSGLVMRVFKEEVLET